MKQVSQTKSQRNKKRGLALLIAGMVLLSFFGGASISYLATRSTSGAEMDKLQSILNILTNNWYYASDYAADPDNEEDLQTRLIEQAIAGMTYLEEDPHTNYFNLEQAQAFSKTLSGSNVGIGISFVTSPDGNMLVKQVFTDSTADQAGLQKGDLIVKVEDLVVADADSDTVIALIKDSADQDVDLEVERNGETMTLTVHPGSYDTTVSETIHTEDDYGEIILNSFSENSGTVFAQAISRLKEAGVSNLVLDLRNNTGGYVSAAQEIASSLLPADSVVFLEDNGNGKMVEFKTKDGFEQAEFEHIYVLQNENTASASEVLIGALKDNLPEGMVTTIGSVSYGKGTEQRSIPFQDGTSIKYTVAEWLTPNGTSINKIGFTPDIAVDLAMVNTVTYRDMNEDDTIVPDTVHENAGAVQVFLQFLGYPVDRTDNYFSEASAQALSAFQSDQGLDATGIVDKATFDRLLSQVSTQLSMQEDELDTARQAAVEAIRNADSASS